MKSFYRGQKVLLLLAANTQFIQTHNGHGNAAGTQRPTQSTTSTRETSGSLQNTTSATQNASSQSTSSTSKSTFIPTSSTLYNGTSATQNASSQSTSSTSKSTFIPTSSTLYNGTSDNVESFTAKNASNHDNTVAIVAPIIAVLVIVAVIILAAVAWKKRRNTLKRTNSIKNDLRNDFHITVESTERDTVNITPNGCSPIYSSLDIEQPDTHTYDQIPQVGDSRKASFLMASDHYDPGEPEAGSNAFNMHSINDRKDESNLNCKKQREQQDGTPVYMLAQNTGNKPETTDETTDEYNRIVWEDRTSGDRSDDTTVNKLPAKSHVPVYSLAQNTGHKPEITDETTNDYNRIDLEGHTSGNQPEDTTLNVYNKLQTKAHESVYSLAQNTGHKPYITDETTNDYNRIDFEGHTSGNQPGGTTLNVYNKLQTKAHEPMYSLVQKSGQEKDITDTTLGECNRTEREQETPGKKAGDKLVSPLYEVPPNRNNELCKPVMPQDDYNKL